MGSNEFRTPDSIKISRGYRNCIVKQEVVFVSCSLSVVGCLQSNHEQSKNRDLNFYGKSGVLEF